MLLRQYQREVDEEESSNEKAQAPQTMNIKEEQSETAKLRQEYQEKVIESAPYDKEERSYEQSEQKGEKMTHIDKLLNKLEQEAEDERLGEVDYTDSEDEVSYGQYGNSFYTKIEPDEDLIEKQEILFGTTERKAESTTEPDISTDNLSREPTVEKMEEIINLAQPQPKSKAQPQLSPKLPKQSPEIKEEPIEDEDYS